MDWIAVASVIIAGASSAFTSATYFDKKIANRFNKIEADQNSVKEKIHLLDKDITTTAVNILRIEQATTATKELFSRVDQYNKEQGLRFEQGIVVIGEKIEKLAQNLLVMKDNLTSELGTVKIGLASFKSRNKRNG